MHSAIPYSIITIAAKSICLFALLRLHCNILYFHFFSAYNILNYVNQSYSQRSLITIHHSHIFGVPHTVLLGSDSDGWRRSPLATLRPRCQPNVVQCIWVQAIEGIRLCYWYPPI